MKSRHSNDNGDQKRNRLLRQSLPSQGYLGTKCVVYPLPISSVASYTTYHVSLSDQVEKMLYLLQPVLLHPVALIRLRCVIAFNNEFL